MHTQLKDKPLDNAPADPKLALFSWMTALADPTRVRLLRLLARQELGVVELCDVLQLPQSTISRHLKILTDEGWMVHRRQGTSHFYRVIPDELPDAARALWTLARQQTDSWNTVRQDELRLNRLQRQKENQSQAFFAGAAQQWQQLRTQLYGEAFTHAALLALLPSEYVVADLGCGDGQAAALIAPFVRQVIGIDNSPAMLKAAQKRLGRCENVQLRRGELQALPIDAASCDVAFCLLVLTYVPHPEIALAEMARILKPGGKLVLVDLLPHDREDFRRQLEQHHRGFDSTELSNWLHAAGFAKAQVQPLVPEPSAKGPALFLATAQCGSKPRTL